MPDKTLKIPRNLTRAASMTGDVDADARTVRMSISSDTPYKRYDWWADEEYWEVLDHSPGGIEDERLKAGLPILFNHSRDKHLGRGQSFECDGHKCDVVVKFSESDFAEEKWKDVKSGILVDTSVGYELMGDGICIGAKDELPIYKFRFKVFEASLVTIPADASVGVGRQRDQAPDEQPKEILIKGIDSNLNSDTPKTTKALPNSPTMNTSNLVRSHLMLKQEGGEGGGGEAPPIDVKAERAAELAAFKARCKKIDDFVRALTNAAWRVKAEAIASKHKDGDAIFDEFRAEALNVFTQESSDIEVVGERGQKPSNGHRALSVGAQFIRSKDFQERATQTGRRRSITIDTDMSVMGIRGKVQLAQRAGFNSSDLTAINVAPQQQMVALGMERLTIMDLISPGTTGAAAIPYPKETTQGTLDGVAVISGMPRAGSVGERGIKPTWEPDITTDTANVKKIAVVTKVPDEFLADFPGFQSYIDARLPAMVDFQAENQILYGDGIGNNIKGILTNAGVLTRAYATNWFTTIRKAITDVEVTSFFTVDAIAMHPYDWEVASLELDANNQPYAGGPFYIPYGNGVFMEMRTFWGKPVVVTVGVTVGQPVIGCWKLGAQYFMREGMRIETTNSNEDDFKRNLIALRAEERLALATYRPSCFLEVTGGPART